MSTQRSKDDFEKNGQDDHLSFKWLSWTEPRITPYCPQIDDKVVYFRKGHQAYLRAVKKAKIYGSEKELPQPWDHIKLKNSEFARVISINYEVGPPRVCNVELELLDRKRVFQICIYHIEVIANFLVLKQTFDRASINCWQQGDRFRCIHNGKWETGKIIKFQTLNDKFSNSFFKQIQIHLTLDSNERSIVKELSFWDLIPLDESGESRGMALSSEELDQFLYKPENSEWLNCDRKLITQRIVEALGEMMKLVVTKPFISPVDLKNYPNYALVVGYPIDLTTIKSRFSNFYYRRMKSAMADVKFIARNAETYNKPEAKIVDYAQMTVELCLRIFREAATCDSIDVRALYKEIEDAHHPNSEVESISSNHGPIKRVICDKCEEEIEDSESHEENCVPLLPCPIDRCKKICRGDRDIKVHISKEHLNKFFNNF